MRLALALVALAFPASAAAAPFGELPFRPVAGSATCLRATGVPGELVRWTRGGVELLAARPDGIASVGTVALGVPFGCPAAAGHENGAAVLAAAGARGVTVALREPGGGWGAPVTLPAEEPQAPRAAINAQGDAVVLWGESRADYSVRLRAVRRPAGGSFGPAEAVGDGDGSVAVTGDGETFLVTTDDGTSRLASAPRSGPFGPARRLVRSRGPGETALAAAADGRVLAAVASDRGLVLFEREPGGALVRYPARSGLGSYALGVALREGGAAVVTWGLESSVGAMVRSGPGAFGPPVELAETPPSRPVDDGNILSVGLAVENGSPPYEGQSRVRAAIGADGRALLGWGIEDAGVRLATVTAAGGVERQTLGGNVRDGAGITPLLLEGGVRALAWTDNVSIFSAPPYAGRLHLALEGAAPAPAAPPAVTIGPPRDRSLRPGQPLVLPVRCRAACDVRAAFGSIPMDPGRSLSRAGTARLRFEPPGEPIAPRGGGPVTIRVRWSAPGSATVRTRTLRVRLQRAPAPRPPLILGVRARRLSGGRVEVRWRSDGPAIDAYWVVHGTRTADREAAIVASEGAASGDRRRHRVVLRDAAGVRHVHVTLVPKGGTRGNSASARVP